MNTRYNCITFPNPTHWYMVYILDDILDAYVLEGKIPLATNLITPLEKFHHKGKNFILALQMLGKVIQDIKFNEDESELDGLKLVKKLLIKEVESEYPNETYQQIAAKFLLDSDVEIEIDEDTKEEHLSKSQSKRLKVKHIRVLLEQIALGKV